MAVVNTCYKYIDAVRELFMNILHVLFYLFVIVRNSLCGWEKNNSQPTEVQLQVYLLCSRQPNSQQE